MEYVVQQVGLDITKDPTLAGRSWFRIIEVAGKIIAAKFPIEKDPERVKWERALGSLDIVRIAWRNPTMHPGEKYTEEEAENIIRAVKTLLREIVVII